MGKLRSDIPVPTGRLSSLPVGDNGYPVPWFVAWIDGKPEFRVSDPNKIVAAIQQKLCWVCGQPLGKFQTFVAGPLSCVNAISAEPPSHKECAVYSAMACPFLAKPHMHRRPDENGDPMGVPPPGHCEHNPGVTGLWTTTYTYTYFFAGRSVLFDMPEPESLEWWARGRLATAEELENAKATAVANFNKVATEDRATPAEIAEWMDKATKLFTRWPACESKNNSSPTSESSSSTASETSG